VQFKDEVFEGQKLVLMALRTAQHGQALEDLRAENGLVTFDLHLKYN